MPRLSRWLVRLGALLLVLSPLVPQVGGGGRSYSAPVVLAEVRGILPAIVRFGLAAWLWVPLAGGLVLLAGSRARPPGALVRIATLLLLFLVAFGLSTGGSIVLTETDTNSRPAPVSFPLALTLFLLPIVLASGALGRLVGGDFARSTGGYARLSLGLLLAANGLLQAGWEEHDFPAIVHLGTLAPLVGAVIAPAGGLLVAAGEALLRLRPRSAMDTAGPSG